jgi:2-keto-4-pentenoate hydratase/2-oxohepta-3-ene-1,7-dioic acid hydratase in catechol pathway
MIDKREQVPTCSLSFLYSSTMRIIRFIPADGRPSVGEDHEDGTATILTGSVAVGFTRTTQRAAVKKLLAPIQPTDIICIGRNYRSPAPQREAASDERPQSHRPEGMSQREEDGNDAQSLLTEPDSTLEVFLKPSTAIQNPGEPILMPRFDDLDLQLDCEGELAVIIGREARQVSEEEALRHVFGYTIANDVTARAFQRLSAGGPPMWMRGKGFDTFLPIGPAIITADEIPHPQSLDLRTIINGGIIRDGNTRQMIRTVPQIIASLSRHMTLRPGALIITGAPAATQAAPLIAGSAVEVEVPSIGRLVNSIM